MIDRSPGTASPLGAGQFEDGRRWLSEMAFIRAFEAAALRLSTTDPPTIKGSLHLCAGQEAVPVGAVAALAPDDQIIATYRGHGWALVAGVEPRSLFAEICHKESGVNGGRGGSAYFMAPWTRFIGENSIVGAGTTIACGIALANALQGTTRIVVVTIGDGAMNQGSVHEAMAWAGVRSLPVVFVIENNGWSELTATRDMYRITRLAQRAAGYGIPSATLAGHDPFVVREAVSAAAARAREGKGPTVLEFIVPRLWGHYNRDIEHYRPSTDRADAASRDPLPLLAGRLVQSGAESGPGAQSLIEAETAALERLVESVLRDPDPEPGSAAQPAIAATVGATPRVLETREMKYIEAVNLALRTELQNDARTIVFGEDVGKSGGIFQASRYLQRDFGAARVFDTPIAENAILGTALGAALAGLRPIAEIMWADFLFVAIDQLVNQAANVRYLTGGRSSAPMVVRTQQGVTPGSCAQHSQSIEALLAHVPGLKVALPSCPNDAYALLRAAAADPDPCIVIESRGLYQNKGMVEITDHAEPIGQARLRCAGRDVLLVAWGATVAPCMEAARVLADDGVGVAVLDLRWLAPLDEAALCDAVRGAEGRVLIVHEAVRTSGFGAELIARLHELVPAPSLRVERVTTPDVRMPASPALQAALVPSVPTIVRRVRDLLGRASTVARA
jgi:2-oxoisovalerate dehydrogenase E1 component